jgi:uncharacterized protein (TIGR00369 family)
MYSMVAKDGTVIALLQRGVLLAKLIYPSGVRYEIEKFHRLGSFNSETAVSIGNDRQASWRPHSLTPYGPPDAPYCSVSQKSGGVPAACREILGCMSKRKTYGTVAADTQRQMSGLEFVQGLVAGTLPLNTIAETLGYDVTEVVNGRVVVTAEPNVKHLNPSGTVHGGLAATLLDSCMGLAIRSTLEKGLGSTTLEFKISLLRPITPETGPIRAEGLVVSCGRRIGTAEGRITDQQGRLLAHGTTTCLIFQT